MNEYENTHKISSAARVNLVHMMYEFLIKQPERQMDQKRIENLCLVTIDVFPVLRVEPSKIKGIVSRNE